MTAGVGFGWAGSAVVGGSLVGIVGFNGLFYLSAALTLTAGMITCGYQRAGRQRMSVSTIAAGDPWPGQTNAGERICRRDGHGSRTRTRTPTSVLTVSLRATY